MVNITHHGSKFVGTTNSLFFTMGIRLIKTPDLWVLLTACSLKGEQLVLYKANKADQDTRFVGTTNSWLFMR